MKTKGKLQTTKVQTAKTFIILKLGYSLQCKSVDFHIVRAFKQC